MRDSLRDVIGCVMLLVMSAVTELPQRRRTPRDTFGARLVLLRHDMDMTQQEVADLCGVKRASWAVWEKGALPRTQADVAKKIADATGYDLRWLLYGGPDGPNETTGRFRVRVTAQERSQIVPFPTRRLKEAV